MQEHLRFTLLIIGICIIGGILLHGMWSIRQNSKKNKRNSFESRNWDPGFEHEDDLETEGPIFDDVGISRAKVTVNPVSKPDNENVTNFDQETNTSFANDVLSKSETSTDNEDSFESPISELGDGQNIHISQLTESLSETDKANFEGENEPNEDENEANTELKPNTSDLETENQVTIEPEQLDNAEEENDSENESPPVYSNVVTQPKPEYNKNGANREAREAEFGQPPEFLLKKGDELPEATDNIESNTARVNTNKENQAEKVTAPDFSLNIQEGPITQSLSENTQSTHHAEDDIVDEKPSHLKPGVEKELSFAEQAKRFVRRNKKTVADKIRKDPVLKNGPAADQMRIDFDNSAVKPEQGAATAASSGQNGQSAAPKDNENASQSQTQSASTATDVLVLNVRANNDKPIEGASLLPMLLTLGFKFGEHDIFHRHVNTNGKGPILFSLTNMFKPGVFDIDNLENFSTQGVSLFMMLPIEGDAQQVFNMMHNAARKLSDEFDCRILDGNKVGLSKQSLQQYVERIREFERKRQNR